jgi:hypothetical protein
MKSEGRFSLLLRLPLISNGVAFSISGEQPTLSKRWSASSRYPRLFFKKDLMIDQIHSFYTSLDHLLIPVNVH